MKVTLLGCGTSVGVPALGHAGWGACDPTDPRNRRQRCAVLVETAGKTILVDAGPDIRNQLLPLGLQRIDALLITHTHSDHVAGL
ncbi:MAG: MBL fold metallo-hydrolase, partial [Candidatus Puniceispirillum sp.]